MPHDDGDHPGRPGEGLFSQLGVRVIDTGAAFTWLTIARWYVGWRKRVETAA